MTVDANSVFSLLEPPDLGLPSKFQRFRPVQREGLEWFMSSSSAVAATLMQTGSGKTAFALAIAQLLDCKTVYLVATKALEQQVLADAQSLGMTCVHGRANYRCRVYSNCDYGYDHECSNSNSNQCPYANAVEAARNAKLIVTNYSYWLNARRNSKALETDEAPVELLICDEAHSIESQLTSYASVSLFASEHGLDRDLFEYPSGLMSDDAAAPFATIAKEIISSYGNSKDEDTKDLVDRARKIARMAGNSNFVWQFNERNALSFEPVRLSAYSRQLFSGVPRVLLMSASLDPFALRMILSSDQDYDYRSFPGQFPPQNAPVYHVPVRKLSWRSSDEDYAAVFAVADNIIDRRTDRKGIIHTVSYARTKRILASSRHHRRFIWNDNGASLGSALDLFRRADAGAIFVSPSVEEAFDFPGEQAEYQILVKFPFPNEQSRVVKERCKIPGYRLHHAAQKVVQIKGRPIRSETDRSELFILDKACAQLNSKEARPFLPPGFRIFTVATAPPPPPRIKLNR